MGCCISNINGLSGASSGSSAAVVSAEFDFTNQGTVVLANGPQNITDTAGRTLAGTVAQVANAATFRFLAGTGLQFVANATSTLYTSASQTASNFEWSLATIYTTYGIDASYDIYMRIYASVQTFPTPNVTGGLAIGSRGVAGTPSNGAARLRGLIRSNQTNAQVFRHGTDGTGGQSYVMDGAPNTQNVFGVSIANPGTDSLAGLWQGTFASTRMTSETGPQPATTANTSGYKDRGNVLYLAFGTGNVNADVVVTIERMRFDFRAAAAA